MRREIVATMVALVTAAASFAVVGDAEARRFWRGGSGTHGSWGTHGGWGTHGTWGTHGGRGTHGGWGTHGGRFARWGGTHGTWGTHGSWGAHGRHIGPGFYNGRAIDDNDVYYRDRVRERRPRNDRERIRERDQRDEREARFRGEPMERPMPAPELDEPRDAEIRDRAEVDAEREPARDDLPENARPNAARGPTLE